MSFSYSVDTEELRENGTIVATISCDLNQELASYLGSPKWISAINAGRGTIDIQARTVAIPELGKLWTIRTDESRPEIADFVQEAAAALSISPDRALALVKVVVRVVRKMKELGRI